MRRRRSTLKEADAFQETAGRALGRVVGLGPLLLAALAGLLVAMAALWAVWSWRERRDVRAWARLAAVGERPETSPEAGPGRAEALEKLLPGLKGTSARPPALLDLAALLHGQSLAPGKKDQRAALLERALRLADDFLADYPRHALAVLARERRALILEDLGRHEEAGRAFAEAAEAARKSVFSRLAGKLTWGQARCALALGRKDEGRRLLEQVKFDAGAADTDWGRAAAQRLAIEVPAVKDLRVPGAAGDQPPEKPGEEPEPPAAGAGAEAPAAPESPPAPAPPAPPPAPPG